MIDTISLFLQDHPLASNAVFVTFVIWLLKSNEADFRRDRRRNYCRAYKRDGVLCGGVVTERKFVGDKQYIRFAYRLPQSLDTAYVKDFVEAPEELKEHHQNIIVVLFPKYSRSGIHYGVLQKLMASKDIARKGGTIGYEAFLRICLLQGVMVLWASLGSYFFWACQFLLYVGLYQLYRINKTEEEATGVTAGFNLKTLKRRVPQRRSWFWSKSDDLDNGTIQGIFLALEKSEFLLSQIMESLDPDSSGKYGTTFPCEKYISLASRCQQALQRETAMFDT